MTHKSSSSTLSRKHKWLRYFLRRKPCFYISICEAATFTFLSIILFLCIYFYIEMRDIRHKYDAEEAQLQTLSNFKTFAHCFYNPLENSNFHTVSCGENSRNQSFAWRHYVLHHQNEEPTCIDRREEVNCHEHISKENFNIELIDNISACAGFRSLSMENRSISSRPSIEIKHPRISNLLPYHLKILHASELFIKCPKCKKTTVPFKWKKKDSKCLVKLSTINYGWPSKFYECDNMLVVSDTQCSHVL